VPLAELLAALLAAVVTVAGDDWAPVAAPLYSATENVYLVAGARPLTVTEVAPADGIVVISSSFSYT
jgi:hypothetical protein